MICELRSIICSYTLFTVVSNWFSIMFTKALMMCRALLLQLSKCVQVALLKSSTKVMKYLKLSWVVT